jgi:hypothetical protein
MWLITNDLFRHKRWEFAQVILSELSSRFVDFDKLKADLRHDEPVVAHWLGQAHQAKKAKRKAANRAKLEQQRADAKLARLQEIQAKRQLIDAASFVRNQAVFFDGSDLV